MTALNDQKLHRLLVQRYLSNQATAEELTLFFQLLELGVLDAYLTEAAAGEAGTAPVISLAEERPKKPPYIRSLRFLGAAAVLLLVVAGAIWLGWDEKPHKATMPATALATPEAAPGSARATLTLSTGQVVELTGKARTLNDASARIVQKGSSLLYEGAPTGETVAYNTITTPRGGEYRVTLPDGSKVWLNAGSSLHYPTAFAGAERRVQLTGEAYFEVAKKAAQPFVVQLADGDIQVLGTHFNVMAYPDEYYSKTTLAEGAVLLRRGGTEKRLQPGDGGVMRKQVGSIAVSATDVDHDLAWMRGYFQFDKTSLETIMKQIGRWYDLDIRYEDNVPEKRFVGKISRHTNLSDVLAVLQLSEVKFSMVGKTLTVENK